VLSFLALDRVEGGRRQDGRHHLLVREHRLHFPARLFRQLSFLFTGDKDGALIARPLVAELPVGSKGSIWVQ
jgi:hypothetical protein